MKNYVFRLFLAIMFMNVCTLVANEITLEVRSAAFYHASSRFRGIYGKVSGCYQLEASTPITPCLEEWVNFDWFTKRGHSIGLHDPTRVSIINVSWGVKYPFPVTECISMYAGIGASFSKIWLHNKSEFFHERVSRLTFGALLKSGINYHISKCFFIDFFADYLYQPDVYRTHVDIGGLKLGVGLGTKF